MPRVLAAFVLASTSAAWADTLPSGVGQPVLPPDVQEAASFAKKLSQAFRAVARHASPSVVSIEVRPDVRPVGGMVRMRGMQVPMMMVPQAVPQGVGTGFIVSKDGHVVSGTFGFTVKPAP